MKRVGAEMESAQSIQCYPRAKWINKGGREAEMIIVRLLIVGCFLLLCSCEKERTLTSSESAHLLKVQDGEGIVFVDGKVIHIGNDFVAYGKYALNDSFDKDRFISTYGLTKSRSDRKPYFAEEASAIDWFIIHPNMEIFEVSEGRKTDLTVWIDAINAHIFVESVKW